MKVIDIHDMQLQRAVSCLNHRCVFEMLREIGARFSIRTEIDVLAAKYAANDPKALAATGGDQLPPIPLHSVPR